MTDTAAPLQAVVNQEFARRYLDGLEPLGRRLESRGRTYVVTAVVKDSIYNAFGEPATPIIYVSSRDSVPLAAEIHVRVRPGGEAAITALVRRVVLDLEPDLPIYNVRTMNEHIEANLVFRRIPARLFAVLGPLILALAAIGIYAVVAYTVSLRTTEIGVRIALGATPWTIITGVVGQHLQVVTVGMSAAWLLAFAVMLDAVAPGVDLRVFLGAPALLLGVAAVAAWLPVRRVLRGDPLSALRRD
jgi:ABC-type antimicrobial peptide transport system permease subunit